MQTRTRLAGRPGRPAPSAPPTLAVALALLAGCGGDGNDDPVDDVPTEDGQSPATPVPVPVPVPVPDSVSEPGPGIILPEGTQTSLGTAIDPAADDRDALVVELQAGASAETTSPYLVFMDLFALSSFPSELGGARVQLIRFEEPIPFGRHVDFYVDYIGELDTCITRDLIAEGGPDGEGGPGVDRPDDPLQVSGGQALLVSSPAGSFGEIPMIEDPGNVYYDAGRGLPGPLPPGATLSIPGNVFPTVADYPLPEIEGPVRLSPIDGEELTTTSEYRWVAGGDRTLIELAFLADDPATGEFLGFPVSCYARDDGEFELTDAALAALLDIRATLRVRYSRVAARIELRDDIAFFTYNELAE